MVRVCHVITSLETGGAQSMLARLLAAEQAREVESTVVSLLPGGALRPRMEELCPRVFDLGVSRRWPNPLALPRLVKLLKQEQPDVVQTWLYHADILGTLAVRWAKVGALAWNLRCSYGHAAPRLFARTAPHVCAKLSGRPAAIITNSTMGRTSHERIGYRPKRWELIPNGFDLEQLAPLKGARQALLRSLGLSLTSQLVGMVARLHPVKDHALVVRTMHALSADFPDAVLVLVGDGLAPGDRGFERLLASATSSIDSSAGSSPRIIGLGPRSDVTALMSGFDVLVSASTHEGFPNVLGEALACGTPCVATDAGDSLALVGEAGRVVSVGDSTGFQKALAEILSMDEAERVALGARGREQMLERYSIGGIARRYVSLWEELSGAVRKGEAAER